MNLKQNWCSLRRFEGELQEFLTGSNWSTSICRQCVCKKRTCPHLDMKGISRHKTWGFLGKPFFVSLENKGEAVELHIAVNCPSLVLELLDHQENSDKTKHTMRLQRSCDEIPVRRHQETYPTCHPIPMLAVPDCNEVFLPNGFISSRFRYIVADCFCFTFGNLPLKIACNH